MFMQVRYACAPCLVFIIITGYYLIGRTLRKDDELVSEAGIKSNSKLMLLGRKVRLFVVLNCLLSCLYDFNGYSRFYIIFPLLYFHQFCQFCSLTKLNFTKVLPCYTFYVAHVNHSRKYFLPNYWNHQFCKNLATRKFPNIWYVSGRILMKCVALHSGFL